MKHWRYIEEDHVTAHYGLATDEFLMDQHSREQEHEATLRLYTYQDHCALVGRFQNIHAELSLDSIRRHGYQYSRRLTGGGAIIMGSGQLGICLATANTFDAANTRELYQKFSRPIVLALKELGIVADLRGKNDLEVGRKKIAGLGIHINEHGALQFHISLLLDLDIPLMLSILNIPLQKISDKTQIHKVEQRITTISRELGRPVAADEIRARIGRHYEEVFDIQLQKDTITMAEKDVISALASTKYHSDDWIFQNSPEPDMSGMGLKKTGEGLLRTYVALKGETIKSVLITGDFAEHETLFRDIESRLKWGSVDRHYLTRVIDEALTNYQGKEPLLTREDLFEPIWWAAMRAMKEVQYTYEGSCYYPDKKLADTVSSP